MTVKVATCCGCVDLKTGCFIIAYLSLVMNILLPFLIVFDFEMACEIFYIVIPSNPSTVKFIYWFALACVFVSLVFILAFLYGLHKDKRGHVKWFLVFFLLAIGIRSIVIIIKLSYETTGWMVVYFVFFIVVQLYYFVVIRSYYFRMVSRGEPILISKA